MEEVKLQLARIVEEQFKTTASIELERPEEKFGDLSSNIALRLASSLGKSPRDIADVIVQRLNEVDSIADASVAGPGFINIRLDDKLLANTITTILGEGDNFGRSNRYQNKKIVAEYSDPNPFKTLHAGHLYTTLVGDAIANVLEAAGANVIRVNFGGDVGLHAAKAMWGIVRRLGTESPEALGNVPAEDRGVWVSVCYVAGNVAYETDESAKQVIAQLNKRIYELHEQNDKDSPFAQIYWTCRQWSYDGFVAVYKKLEVHQFDKYYPESETATIGLKLVQEGLKTGVFDESEGAIVYAGEKDGLHTRVFLTSEGLPTYETKDLGLVLAKWRDYQFDLSFMITGNDIVEYMKVVQAVSRHFQPEVTERTKHLTHGMIKLPGGKKMSSRKGDVLLADDIIEAATDAYAAHTQQENYSAILAAIKYSFLKQRIGGDIIYDPEESVSVAGSSGPYLQYAHARAQSILAKSSGTDDVTYNLDSTERSLVRKLSTYGEVVEKSVEDLMPHHICSYLYELAQEFNSFYEKNRVIGDEREVYRLQLVRAYAQVLRNGLSILGISAPEHM